MTGNQDDDRDSLLSPSYATKTLALRPERWKAFFNSTMPGALDSNSIEIGCRWLCGWDDHITIGQEKLSKLFISLQIVRADQAWLDKTLADQGIVLDEKGYSRKRPWIGRLNYWKPLDSGDGVVKDDQGSVTGWIAYGPETYDRIFAGLMSGDRHMRLGISVRFNERGGSSISPAYHWDGNGQLDIVDGNIVVFSEDPGSPDDDLEDLSSIEQVNQDQKILSATKRLEAAITGLRFPLWVAVAMLLLLLVFG